MIRGSDAWALLGWMIAFTAITTFAVLLRFWSARIQKRGFYWDDAFVMISYVAMLAQQGVGLWGLENGMGNTFLDLDMNELLVMAKMTVAVSVTWIVSTTTIKLAVLALYMRIFSTASFKKWAYGLMAFTVGFGISFFVAFLTRCSPVSQEWDPQPDGWCRPVIKTELASNSINLVLDLAIVCLPMPWLWKLNMATANKVVAMIMFSFGFATIAIMCYRMEITVNNHADPIKAMYRIGLLSNLELWFGIIAACMPTIAPFFRTYVQPGMSKIFTRIYGSSNGPSEGGSHPRVPLKTFGSSGTSGNRGNHSQYTELGDPAHDPAHDHDELRLVENGSYLRTEVGHDMAERTHSKNGIHVHKQFQTYENV